jgi:SAM-dependent methyltransferase
MIRDKKLQRILKIIRSSLQVPVVYSSFRTLVAGNFDRRFVDEFITPCPTDRILDLGCGPADILDKLSTCQYVGVDQDQGYITRARKRYKNRAHFYDVGIADIDVVTPRSFDIALSIGVLHHLRDTEALHLLHVAHASLKPGGRLITIDGCKTHYQTRLCRFFLELDRGQFVRDKDEYVALASHVFPKVTATMREDLIRIPYTHLIMTCRRKQQEDQVSPERGSLLDNTLNTILRCNERTEISVQENNNLSNNTSSRIARHFPHR